MPRRWSKRQLDPALAQLRRRTSWLIRGLPAQAQAFIRLLPLLLHARFRRPSLDHEPPGIQLAPRRRRWGKLCSQLELPPPTAYTSSRPIVSSVVLSPRVDGRFDVLILPIDNLQSGDVHRLVTHVDALVAIAGRAAPMLDVKLASRAELAPALLPWAAVCAGDLPSFVEGQADRIEVVLRAPTPLARCLCLLVDGDAASPLETLRSSPGPSRPEAFLVRWSKNPLVAAIVNSKAMSLAELKASGQLLRQACTQALRATPPRDRAPLRAALRSELFSSVLPAAFRPHLEALLKGHTATERRGPEGWVLSVDGVELARANTLDQVRADAVAETPLLARPGTPWAKVAKLIASGAGRRNLVVVEADFVKHLVVSFSVSGRPHARRVDSAGLLRFVLTSRMRGLTSEVITSMGSDHSLVLRIAQINNLPTKGPVGVEVGDRLLLADAHRVRSLPLKAALARPRRVTWVPLEHELGRSLRSSVGNSLLATTHATAWPLREDWASVIFVEHTGLILREEVPLQALEAHLVESRELLRQGEVPELMSVTVHPMLAALSGRRLDADLQVLPLEVDCDWPFTLRVWLEGEAFCAPGDLSWSALAESILSHWSPGTWGRVGVRRVRFIRPPPSPSALDVLAVRARVLRRVTIALRRLTRLLEAA